jgi:hypothetical protein
MRSMLCPFALFILIASTTVAGPAPQLTVTSISPAEGPVAGSTVVEIRGTGFERPLFSPVRPGTEVFFGDTRAADVGFIDETSLRVVTPAHFPGNTTVRVFNDDGSTVTVPNAFTFVGDVLSGFDVFLFPIFAPRSNGAFGSIFETTALVGNRHTEISELLVYGATDLCLPVVSNRPLSLFSISQNEETRLSTDCSTWPARLIYAPKTTSRMLAASLRVSDITRQAESHGVEIPVVRLDQFTRDRVALIGVPSDPRFRKMLRIYAVGTNVDHVLVRVDGSSQHRVDLTPGRSPFEPAFATFTAFPTPADLRGDQTTFNVTVDTPRAANGASPIANAPLIWAFISITNNDTQMITTVIAQHSNEVLFMAQ